jgi:hypothetical protein
MNGSQGFFTLLYGQTLLSRISFRLKSRNYRKRNIFFVLDWCTEVRFTTFASGGFSVAVIVNLPSGKLVSIISVWCAKSTYFTMKFWFILIHIFLFRIHDVRIKRLFTSWVFFRSTRLWYATSKNHRTSFAKKNYCERNSKKKRRKHCT